MRLEFSEIIPGLSHTLLMTFFRLLTHFGVRLIFGIFLFHHRKFGTNRKFAMLWNEREELLREESAKYVPVSFHMCCTLLIINITLTLKHNLPQHGMSYLPMPVRGYNHDEFFEQIKQVFSLAFILVYLFGWFVWLLCTLYSPGK